VVGGRREEGKTLLLIFVDPNAKLNNFTVLVGVYLSDCPEEDSGNFTVFPGSHYQIGEYFKEHGPDSILTKEGMF
jgi:hypothetical protein